MIETNIKPLKIGKYKFDYPIFSAPLAGYSDKGYRRVLKEAKVPLVFSEMVSAKALLYDSEKSHKIIDIINEEKPIGVQIFGSEPEIVAEAGRRIEALGADIIDFNIGCPAPKIVKNGEGSALLENPTLALKVLEALVKAVKVPVTLKIRKGFTENSGDPLPIIKGAEALGLSAVFLHGRTREQYYSGKADWDFIAKVKDQVEIPIIGNGDVVSPEGCEALFLKSKCDGVLIGRGFLGNPLLYQNCLEYFKTGSYNPITLEDRVNWMLKQLSYTVMDKGEVQGVKEMRKQVIYYFKGIRNGAYYRNQFNQCMNQSSMEALALEILESSRENE